MGGGWLGGGWQGGGWQGGGWQGGGWQGGGWESGGGGEGIVRDAGGPAAGCEDVSHRHRQTAISSQAFR